MNINEIYLLTAFILARMPEIEDFLHPDLIVREYDFDLASDFTQIDLSSIRSNDA